MFPLRSVINNRNISTQLQQPVPFPTSSARAISAHQVDSSQLHVASMQPEQLAPDKGHDEMKFSVYFSFAILEGRDREGAVCGSRSPRMKEAAEGPRIAFSHMQPRSHGRRAWTRGGCNQTLQNSRHHIPSVSSFRIQPGTQTSLLSSGKNK
jgi:hypothetical protein